MDAPHTGTTVVALAYGDGVIVGADSRVSMGTYISNRASNKLTPLTDNVWLLRSGSAADAQAISDYVRYWACSHTADLDREPSVRSVANLVKQLCYNNKHLQGALIVAGWDIYQGGQVYCLPIGGTLVQEKWAADGSGSLFLMGYMDSVFRENVRQAEAEKVVTTALSLAMARDGSSGGMIRLAVCDKNGSTHRSIPGDKIKTSWDETLEMPISVHL